MYISTFMRIFVKKVARKLGYPLAKIGSDQRSLKSDSIFLTYGLEVLDM